MTNVQRIEVDHTPGGSPETAVAPAPIHVAARFTTNPDPRRSAWTDDAYADVSELYNATLRDDPNGKDGTITVYSGYAMAAARLSLRGAAWSEDDRVECAGMIAAEVTGAAKAPRTGTPQEISAYIEWCWAHPALARRHADCIPRAMLSMTRLTGMAANWRRAEESRRDRDQRAMRERAVTTGFTATAETFQDTTFEPTEDRALRIARDRVQRALRHVQNAPTRAERVSRYIDAVSELHPVQRAEAHAPHVQARAVLGALGLPRLGRAYTAAYVAAVAPSTAAGNDERADIMRAAATELRASSVDVLRVQVNRARKAIPSAETHGYLAHADVLGVTYVEETVQHGLKVSDRDARTSDIDRDVCACRATDERDATPLECPQHPVTTRRLKSTRKVWNGKRTADWTGTLPASTRARLHRAATIRRDRSLTA